MRLKGSLILWGVLGLLFLPEFVSAQATCGDTLNCSGTYAMYIRAQSGTLGLWVRAQNKNAIQAYSKSKTALLVSSDASSAARFITSSTGAPAVYARNDGNNDASDGVYATSVGGDGVYGESTGGSQADNGVYGFTTSTSSYEAGVFGFSASGDASPAAGVIGYSDNGFGVVGYTGRVDNNYGFYTTQNVYIGGKLDLTGVVDPVIGERFELDPDENIEAGDVVVVEEDSQYLTRCSEAYDVKVIGVIGPDLDIKDGEAMVITFGNRGAKPQRAIIGETPERTVIRMKVDADFGMIKRGDLLTTSTTPGHAMKAVPVEINGIKIYPPGTVIGIALESLESGKGTLEVFVSKM